MRMDREADELRTTVGSIYQTNRRSVERKGPPVREALCQLDASGSSRRS